MIHKMILFRKWINFQKKNAKAKNLKPFGSINTTKAESESKNSQIDGFHSMYSSPARDTQNNVSSDFYFICFRLSKLGLQL